MKNPQIFNKLEQLRKSNGDPIKLFKEISGNYKPEQMQQFWNKVSEFGISNETIQKFKNETEKK